jgi:acylpyruvate hydrolase
MRFASVTYEGHALAVAIDGEVATPLLNIAELGARTPGALLANPPLYEKIQLPVSVLHFRPVIPRPGKIICVELNYAGHVDEGTDERPDYPVFFTKFATALTGPYDPIPHPPESEAMDYEGELAIVIGAHARRVPRAAALSKIAGYTVANDVTMRDFQDKTHQWLQGKSWDGATPLGPYLVTPDEVGDLDHLTLRTTVNGEMVQDATFSLLRFDLATLISTVSVFTTLEPGDVILTGTPAGVGYRREPPRLLEDGDTVAVEIERIGRIENRIVLESVA